MLQVENHVGRLIEMTVVTPVTLQELGACLTHFTALATKLPGKFVPVADCRRAHTFPQDVAEGFGKLMRSDNPRIERAAILVGESAVLSMQIERMVREAQNPARRTFRARDAILSWVGEVLNNEERARFAQFLAP